MRLFAVFVVPLFVFGCIELGLRLAGYGYDTHYFRKVRIQGRDYYVSNEKFSDRFFPPSMARPPFPVRMLAHKSTNTCRIFLFGGSAAYGDPDPTYGMGRYLQVLLRERFPGTDFEVICVAITAINSNTVLPIARECARRQGDLWVIYMGNNEMVGPFGAETVFGWRAPTVRVIRAILAVKTTRIGQLLDAVVRRLRSHSSSAKAWGGMAMFARNRTRYTDPARLQVYSNFKQNLEDILGAGRQAGVPVILSTVAVNLKDCAPFASLHAPGLTPVQESAWKEFYEKGVALESAGAYGDALSLYQQAARIDPRYADLQFRVGTCNLALTNRSGARKDFGLARDYDALEFRADSRINATIRAAASRDAGQGVHLVDAARVLAQHSPDGIPGLNFFYEHVHLNFAGNYLLALQFAAQIQGLLPGTIKARDRGRWASAALCDRRLAVTVWDRQRVWQPIFDRISMPPFTAQSDHAAVFKMCEAKLQEAKAQMSSQTPEQARKMYEQALALAPDDTSLLSNFERFLEAAGDLTGAIAETKRFCELMPQRPQSWYHLGTLCVRTGRMEEAMKSLLRAVALQGDYAEAENELGEILANRRKTGDALRWFKRAIRANPDYARTWLNLGFLQQAQGDVDAARASFAKAGSLEPEGPADYFNRAKVAEALGHTDEAITYLRAVVKARHDFWQAHYLLGKELAQQWKTGEAQTQFQEAIRYRPDFADAHFQLGIALAAQHKLDAALAQFRKVLQLDPSNGPARQQIANIQSSEQHE